MPQVIDPSAAAGGPERRIRRAGAGRAVLCDAVFLALLGGYVVGGVWRVPFHGDEATLLFMSRDYAYQFLEHDWDRVRFDSSWQHRDEQVLRMINGTLAKYTYGFAWHLGGYSLRDVNGPWEWRADWASNLARGNMPPAGMLVAARLASSVLLIGAIVALFLLVRSVGGRAAAYSACLYFALNPAVLLNGRRAMMESALLLPALLVVFAAIRYLQRAGWASAMLLGLVAGVALSGKHTNIFPVAAVGAACALYPLVSRHWRLDAGRSVANLVAAALAGTATFLLLNPVWWGLNPLQFAREILLGRQKLLASYMAEFGGYTSVLDQIGGVFRQVFVVVPQYYEVAYFEPWIANEIEHYDRSFWAGLSLGGNTLGGILMFGITAVGIIVFLRRPIPPETRWALGFWAVAILLSTLLLTPLELQRYYIPVFPVIALFFALGLVRIACSLQQSWRGFPRAWVAAVRNSQSDHSVSVI